MMELAPYVYDRHPKKFDDILKLLWDTGYAVSDVSNGRALPGTQPRCAASFRRSAA